MEVTIERISAEVRMPERGTEESAGIDLFIPNEFVEIYLMPNESVLIRMGFKVSIEKNTVLIMKNKSGIASKKKLIVGACVIDSDYQGEVMLDIHNIGSSPQKICGGMKIVQMIHQPIILSNIGEGYDIHNIETQRGDGGFGSTGI